MASVAICLPILALAMFASVARTLHREFGFRNITVGFDLWRFSLFSLLPFAFNICVCAALVFLCFRRTPSGQAHAPKPPRPLAGFLFILLSLGWCFLFNLPALQVAWTAEKHGSTVWPPKTLYAPVRLELALFMPMGNLGALTGFAWGFYGLSLAKTGRRRRPPQARGKE